MDLVERLRSIDVFQEVDDEGLRALASLCQEHALGPGALMCRQASPGATLFLIDSGEALIERVDENGFERPVGMLRAGDHYGVDSLLLAEPRDATVTALQPMRLWTMRRADLLALLEERSELRRALVIPPEIRQRLSAPRFTWLENGERVISCSRRHWVILARSVAPWTLLVSTLTLGVTRLVMLRPTVRVVPLLAGVWGFYGLLVLWLLIDWLNDYFVVTTWRLSARRRVALLYETRDEAPLDRVQNMNVLVGLCGRALGYGTLVIETAATVGDLTFDGIPDPERVRAAVWDQMERARATRQALKQRLVRETLIARLGLAESAVPSDIEERGQDLDGATGGDDAEIGPGRWARILHWLGELEVLPRMRIETAEAVTWRKHWVFLVRTTFVPFWLTVLCGLGSVFGFFGLPVGVAQFVPYYPYVLLGGALLSLAWLWYRATDWGNDLYIVTSDRIVDEERRPLALSSQRREASLAMIQNVRMEVPSFWAALFRYGSVIVQTAGAGAFTFERVPNPSDVQNEIFRRLEAYREQVREQERAGQRQDLAEWFSIYNELRNVTPSTATSAAVRTPAAARNPEETALCDQGDNASGSNSALDDVGAGSTAP